MFPYSHGGKHPSRYACHPLLRKRAKTLQDKVVRAKPCPLSQKRVPPAGDGCFRPFIACIGFLTLYFHHRPEEISEGEGRDKECILNRFATAPSGKEPERQGLYKAGQVPSVFDSLGHITDTSYSALSQRRQITYFKQVDSLQNADYTSKQFRLEGTNKRVGIG